MDKFSIENKIKDRLQDHEVFIDTNDLLISMGLEERDKKKPFFWIWLVAGFIFISSIAGYFMTTHNIDENNKKMVNEYITDAQKQTDKTNEKIKIQKESRLENNSIDLTTNTTKIENSEKQLQNNQTIITRENLTKTSSKKNETRRETKVSKSSTMTKNNNLKTTPNSTTKDLDIDKLDDKYEEELIQHISKSKSDISTKTSINSLPIIENSVKKINTLNLYLTNNNHNNLVDIHHVKSNINRWSILPFGGYGQFKTTLKAKDSEDINYANKRSSQEMSLEVVSGGIYMKYNLKNNLYLKSGLVFDRYNTRLQYSEYLSDSILENGIIRNTITYDGDTILTYGNLISDITTDRKWDVYNSLNVLSIPLSIGYVKAINQWGVFGEVGLTTNIYSLYSGKMINKQGFVDKDLQVYKSTLSFDWLGSLGASYKLNKSTNLWFSFSYRQSLNSRTKKSYALSEKIKQTGVKLGVEFKL